MSVTLHVERVSKSFAGLQALQGVSLELSEHTILGLIGPNGSGKTTLLNIISGVLRPDHGQVLIGDVDVSGWRPDHIARLGVGRTFQTARLFGSLSVVENVELGVMMTSGEDVDVQVMQLLKRLGLAPWASSEASTLPYGVQRRLEIARALGTRPRFLLLDEPAAGLNEEESEELLHVIRNLRDDPEFGCGVLIVDHDLRLIMRLCDRIHVLNEGKSIAEGAPEEVRHDQGVIEAYLGSRHDGKGEVELE